MKPIKWVYLLLTVGLLITLLVTPIEAAYFGQELSWMYQLNLKEFGIFAFALCVGLFAGQRL